MEKLSKSEKPKENAFYGPLPVSKPEPILRPNEHIQLQTIVNPVAIVPYISYEQDADTVEQSSQPKENAFSHSQPKVVKKAKNRICGGLMLLILLLSLMPFVFALFSSYPIEPIEKYIGMNNIINDYKTIISNKMFTNLQVAFPVYMVTIGLISLLINLFKALIALIGGNRRGYGISSVFAFVAFVICGLFLFGFGNIKNITQILSYPNGWKSVTLLAIGAINLVFGTICTLICPKKYKIDTVDF